MKCKAFTVAIYCFLPAVEERDVVNFSEPNCKLSGGAIVPIGTHSICSEWAVVQSAI